MHWAEQAIFTSIRGERLEGYQLAATSPGISSALARELTLWGPAHDSLLPANFAEPSISWFRPADDSFCLAVTQSAGCEYSGRKGPRIYTHFVVLPELALERLANPPWDIYHALRIARRFVVREPLPKRLERCPVVTTEAPRNSSSATAIDVAEIVPQLSAENTLAVVCDGKPESVLETLWHGLPQSLRRTTSFTTGLRYSPRRPFRVHAIPNDPQLVRQLAREKRMHVVTPAVPCS